jgi:hypothetical protein
VKINVYTIWATPKDEEPSPWMIAAEDQFCWEADPERCERVFAVAKEDAARNGWEVREITFSVDWDAVFDAFHPVTLDAEVRLP